MFKEVIRGMDTDILAIIGLVAFVSAFILILVRVFLMSKAERTELKNMPLTDAGDRTAELP